MNLHSLIAEKDAALADLRSQLRASEAECERLRREVEGLEGHHRAMAGGMTSSTLLLKARAYDAIGEALKLGTSVANRDRAVEQVRHAAWARDQAQERANHFSKELEDMAYLDEAACRRGTRLDIPSKIPGFDPGDADHIHFVMVPIGAAARRAAVEYLEKKEKADE